MVSKATFLATCWPELANHHSNTHVNTHLQRSASPCRLLQDGLSSLDHFHYLLQESVLVQQTPPSTIILGTAQLPSSLICSTKGAEEWANGSMVLQVDVRSPAPLNMWFYVQSIISLLAPPSTLIFMDFQCLLSIPHPSSPTTSHFVLALLLYSFQQDGASDLSWHWNFNLM